MSETRKIDLVELIHLDSSIRLDIRYATSDNFTGQAVYPEARAFLQRTVAEALVRVHRSVSEQGLGLVVFDCYRPWSVTRLFWEVTPLHLRNFVANPEKGSKHNRGCAVDLTLCDRASGRQLPMPSEFDEFTERSYATYSDSGPAELLNRATLREAMEAEGFIHNPYEWWHFDHPLWQEFPILDVPFPKST